MLWHNGVVIETNSVPTYFEYVRCTTMYTNEYITPNLPKDTLPLFI